VARTFEVVGSKRRLAVLRSLHLSGEQGFDERKETTTAPSATVAGSSGRQRPQKPINSRPEDSPIAIDDTLTERGKRAGPRHRVRTKLVVELDGNEPDGDRLGAPFGNAMQWGLSQSVFMLAIVVMMVGLRGPR